MCCRYVFEQVELAMALGQKDEAMQAVEVQGRELEHKIEQAEALRAVIRRLQGSSSRASLLHMHSFATSTTLPNFPSTKYLTLQYY